MKTTNKVKTTIILAFSLICCGCATVKISDFSVDPDVPNLSVKGTMNKESWPILTSFKILSINGKPIKYGCTGHYYDSEVVLDEGYAILVVETTRNDGFFEGIYTGTGEISTFLSGGRKYQVNGKYDGLIRMWIEDVETHKGVSHIVNVPVFREPTDIYVPIYVP